MSDALDAEVIRIRTTVELLDVGLSGANEETAKVVSNILTLAPTARVDNGLLKTVASFLKDNSITAALGDEEGADETAEKLAELRSRRRTATLPTDLIN
jgi:hypothetical protein